MNDEISPAHIKSNEINLQYERLIHDFHIKNIAYLHDKMSFIEAFNAVQQNHEFILNEMRWLSDRIIWLETRTNAK